MASFFPDWGVIMNEYFSAVIVLNCDKITQIFYIVTEVDLLIVGFHTTSGNVMLSDVITSLCNSFTYTMDHCERRTGQTIILS